MEDNRVSNNCKESMASDRGSLRVTDADIKVVLGRIEDGEIREFWHSSQLLASQSHHVGTLLSNEMDIDNMEGNADDYKTITFPDIAPSQWERMIRFLSDPKSMKVEDAMELAQFYDLYEFPIGIEICDEILSEKAVFHSEDSDVIDRKINDFTKLDQCIEAIVLSHKTNLSKTFEKGKSWLSMLLSNALDPIYIRATQDLPFTESQMKAIVPVIETSLQYTVTWSFDDIDFKAADFPANLLRIAAHCDHIARLEYPRVRVEFSTDGNPAAGIYHHALSGTDGIAKYQRLDNDQQIVGEVRRCPVQGIWEIYCGDTIMYRCVSGGGQFSSLPPTSTHWFDVVRNFSGYVDGRDDLPDNLPLITALYIGEP